MSEGTKQDYEMLQPAFESHARPRLVPNLLSMLDLLKGPKLGYQVDRYQHSLQSASRALRNDERLDLVVGALLPDVADCFAPQNHSDAAATIVAPYVDAETHWIVKHHGIFQGYYYFHFLGMDQNARDKFTGHPHYEACRLFCEKYDQAAFDPDYDSEPLEFFEPMVRRVMARPLASAYAKALEQE